MVVTSARRIFGKSSVKDISAVEEIRVEWKIAEQNSALTRQMTCFQLSIDPTLKSHDDHDQERDKNQIDH